LPSCSAFTVTVPFAGFPFRDSVLLSIPRHDPPHSAKDGPADRSILTQRLIQFPLSSPDNTNSISFPIFFGEFTHQRGNLLNTFPIGTMRVFITAICSSVVD